MIKSWCQVQPIGSNLWYTFVGRCAARAEEFNTIISSQKF